MKSLRIKNSEKALLERNKKYLQVVINQREYIYKIISSLPSSDNIILEIGYPLIKEEGVGIIEEIKEILRLARKDYYLIADLKCMDRAFTEIDLAYSAGANAVTCLGLAPIETIDLFVEKCYELGTDSYLDMLNVEFPFEILKKLKKPPSVIMIHRGVDENEENPEKELYLHEIEKIKNVYDDVLIAIAGGETIAEVFSSFFNGADISVVWRPFNENPEKVKELIEEYLKEVK